LLFFLAKAFSLRVLIPEVLLTRAATCRDLVTFIATALLACVAPMAGAEDTDDDSRNSYPLHYFVELLPDQDMALVRMSVPDAQLLREINFNLTEQHSEVQANGELTLEDGRAVWIPPAEDAQIQWRTRISQKRSGDTYDAFITPSWAIFRGDDLIPPARVRTAPGAMAQATLSFTLPKGWSVNTGWESISDNQFKIDNPSRRFDRPIGWMIAGKLGTRRDTLASTRVSVSAPQGADFHRMDVLSFVTMVWPEIDKLFRETPPYLLLVGGGDPMWLGGLSAPNSLFLHADRPLVSENGTSTLIHELVHVVGGIRGTENNDWITEGIAEYYAVELLYRSGGLTDERRNKVFADLREWGKDVETLQKSRSRGTTTARAVVLFEQLDQELREHSKTTLDDLVRALQEEQVVSLEELRAICRELASRDCRTLDTPLLKNEETAS
jgi:hypothetical protein